MFFDEYSTSDTLRKITKIDPAIEMAQMRLEAVTANEEFRQAYEFRQKVLHDKAAGEKAFFEQGIEQGIEQGCINIAKKALSKGYSIDTIQELTGLKVEDITALQTK